MSKLGVAALAAVFVLAASGAARADHDEAYRYDGRVTRDCNSSGYDYEFCPVPGGVRSAELIRRRSEAGCRYGSDWGFNRRGVWTDNGCRGTFAVAVGGGDWGGPGWGRGGNDRWDDRWGGRRDGRWDGLSAEAAIELCEREGESRLRRNGRFDFRFERRADVERDGGEGWSVSGPARVRTVRGEQRVYAHCHIRRRDVVSFDVSDLGGWRGR